MFNGNIIEKTYVYDGTFEGLLSMVFDCYIEKGIPLKIMQQEQVEPNFLTPIEKKETDYTKAKRIVNGIVKNISYSTLAYSYQAFLSNQKEKEVTILTYLLNAFCIGPKINTMISIDFVFAVHSMQKKVIGELHRFKGLLRFMEIKHNLLYASIHPEHDILEHLGQHFIKRLPTQDFILHDKNRNLAFLYHEKEYQIVDSSSLILPTISEEEKKYQALWTAFFQTIAIKERTNPRLQMQYMPKKYWQDLIELQ